ARVVDQVVPDPLERLPGRTPPPVDGGVLDAVALAVVVGVLRRSRLLDHKIDRLGGGDGRAAYRADRDYRGRGGITFSREAHRALSARADLAVSRQAVRLLPRLDLRDGARADLPVHSRANDALHGGMIQQSLMLHLVQRGDVTEVPVLADTLPLVPAPPVQATIRLEPILDSRRMNINRAPILMIRTKIRRRNIHATGLAHPNLASIRPVRLELPATPSRGIVLLKQRDLLSLRTASRPNTKVRASISDRTIQRPRQSLVSAAFKPLDFILVRPRCGKLRRCHKGLLSGIEKAPGNNSRGLTKVCGGQASSAATCSGVSASVSACSSPPPSRNFSASSLIWSGIAARLARRSCSI